MCLSLCIYKGLFNEETILIYGQSRNIDRLLSKNKSSIGIQVFLHLIDMEDK